MKTRKPRSQSRALALAIAALLGGASPLPARAAEGPGREDLGPHGSAAPLVAPDGGAPVPAAEAGAGGVAPSLAPEPVEDPLDPDGESGEESSDDDPADDQPTDAEMLAGEPSDGGNLYTSELSDAEVERRFLHAPRALGPVSIGFAESGRLLNGVQLPPGDCWTVMCPDAAFGTLAVVEDVMAIARAVRARFPDAPPLRVNHMGKEKGGNLRPHKSHQSGRDVDLGFYYRPGVDPSRLRGKRLKLLDLPANWALVRAIATLTDAQVVLVDRTVQKALYDFALAQGEDVGWLHDLFKTGKDSLLRHARGHRDHFHVRFYSARAQELGVRVHPLLAKVPEQNVVIHKVRRGDTLGALARRYGSTVTLIQKANAMRKSTSLRPGRTLEVPLRGPCIKCPLPPRVLVPPRRLPPPPRTP